MEVVAEILEEKDSEKRLHLRKTKAAEVRLVRNMQSLISPTLRFKAKKIEI
jgi:pyridoxine kinase